MQPASPQTGRREPRQRGRFVKESWAELQKVDWPGRAQVIQGTIVVIIACIIVGAYLYGADQAFSPSSATFSSVNRARRCSAGTSSTPTRGTRTR